MNQSPVGQGAQSGCLGRVLAPFRSTLVPEEEVVTQALLIKGRRLGR